MVWNGHYACTCYHPLFVFNQFRDLERCALRAGNVHSADGWDDVLKPVVARYQGKVSRIYLLVRAGVDLTPNWVRAIVGLNGHGLHPWEAEVIRQAGAFADRLVLASNPAVSGLWADAPSGRLLVCEHRSVFSS
jgi:Transposase DDE domain group 1